MDTDKRTLEVPISHFEMRDTGSPTETTLTGYAAVFNSLSEDLGGFREQIERGFFRGALRRKPDVRLLVNHDDLPLARTKSGTLELSEDEIGLRVFASLDKTDPDVIRLRTKMQRGDVDQMSFAFTLREDGDDWAVQDDDTIVRTLRADGADDLFDVSVVSYPAYQATSVSMRSVLQDAISRGRVPLSLEQAVALTDDCEDVAPAASDDPVGVVSEAAEVEYVPLDPEERDVAPAASDDPVGVTKEDDFAAWQASIRAQRTEANESYLRLLREHELA